MSDKKSRETGSPDQASGNSTALSKAAVGRPARRHGNKSAWHRRLMRHLVARRGASIAKIGVGAALIATAALIGVLVALGLDTAVIGVP